LQTSALNWNFLCRRLYKIDFGMPLRAKLRSARLKAFEQHFH
jgi:hypothetical protein